MWHGVNVAPTPPANYVVSFPLTITVNTRVYDLAVTVKDPLGVPIGGADCTFTLANGTTVHTSTAGNGSVALRMIPIGTYQGTVSAFGLSSTLSGNASVQSAVGTQLALSWTMIFVLVVVALIVVTGFMLFVRRHHRPSYRYKG